MTATETTLEQGHARHGIVLLAASVMPIMAISSLVPVLPLLLREFGDAAGAAFLVPVALTVPALCVAIFSPLAGWLSDWVGRKNLLVWALGLYALCGVLPWFLNDLGQIIAARVALGVCEAAIMTVATALIGDYFEGARRERWIALQVAMGSVAAIVLIALGGTLGELFGSRGPFLLYVLAVPVAVAAALLLFEPQLTPASGSEGKVRFPYAAVMPLILTTIAIGIVFYTVVVQLGPILQLSGEVSPGTIGIVGALTNLSVAGGTFVFKRMTARTGPVLMAAGLVIAGVGYAGASQSDSLVMIATFAMIACIGSGMLLPNMLTWTMRKLPPETRGRGTGMWTGAFFLGQFLAPILTTAVMQFAGGMANALMIYAGLIGLGALAAVFSARTLRSS